MEPKVGIVILNYQNYSDTVDCLQSVAKITYSNYFIVLVDNNSQDESRHLLEKYASDQNITFLQAEKNLGYAGGNNVGIKYAMSAQAEYVCILNNDTEVASDFLEYLVRYLEINFKCAICGPVILDYYDKTIIQSAGAQIKFSTANVNPYHAGKSEELIPRLVNADYISGSCMLVSSKIISIIGYIPEDYFLFFEETDWCYTAKKNGYDITCVTDSKIWHKGSSTVAKSGGIV